MGSHFVAEHTRIVESRVRAPGLDDRIGRKIGTLRTMIG